MGEKRNLQASIPKQVRGMGRILYGENWVPMVLAITLWTSILWGQLSTLWLHCLKKKTTGQPQVLQVKAFICFPVLELMWSTGCYWIYYKHVFWVCLVNILDPLTWWLLKRLSCSELRPNFSSIVVMLFKSRLLGTHLNICMCFKLLQPIHLQKKTRGYQWTNIGKLLKIISNLLQQISINLAA